MNVLAIDQGTSATKALVVADGGEVLALAESPVAPDATADGGVEQDPEQLWRSVCDAGGRAVAAAGVRIDAVGLANQGETVLVWDPTTGRPLTAALSWQDRRATVICDELAGHGRWLAERTGLPLDPYFAAPKMAWLRRRCGDGVVTTTDTWLVHRLTGAYVTDAGTASRTLLLDLDRRTWSAEACGIFGLDPAALPEVVASAAAAGETDAFGPAVPVTGLSVDQQAALVGQRCLDAGDAKCTYGTGAFLLANAGAASCRSAAGLSTSVAWELPEGGAYCVDGQVYAAGAALGWLQRWGWLGAPEDLDAVGGSVPDSGGVTVVPALSGLGAPWWRPSALGTVEGIGPGSEAAHVVRATAEGIAAAVAVLVRAAEADLGCAIGALRVDGGLTRSRLLMQAQADLLQVPVLVAASPHATGLGVAALARLGAGHGGTLADVVAAAAVEAVFEPVVSGAEAAERLGAWEAAAGRAATR